MLYIIYTKMLKYSQKNCWPCTAEHACACEWYVIICCYLIVRQCFSSKLICHTLSPLTAEPNISCLAHLPEALPMSCWLKPCLIHKSGSAWSGQSVCSFQRNIESWEWVGFWSLIIVPVFNMCMGIDECAWRSCLYVHACMYNLYIHAGNFKIHKFNSVHARIIWYHLVLYNIILVIGSSLWQRWYTQAFSWFT